MPLRENLETVQSKIRQAAFSCGKDPNKVLLVAVSKGRSVEEIAALYELGVRDFAENRILEALDKIEKLPKDIRWHFIGNIQSKKINKIIGKFALLHSVDSLDHAQKLSSACQKSGIVQPILLQVNISGEVQKQGMKQDELKAHYSELSQMPGIEVKGLMTMAPFMRSMSQEEEKRVIATFHGLHILHSELCSDSHPILSMGMSQDFEYAIQEGSTLVRIGSLLFSDNQSA